MTSEQRLDRLEKYLALLMKGCDEDRQRSRREFDEKMKILIEKQNQNLEALKQMTEERERRAGP